MKKYLFAMLTFVTLSASAQKDKTLAWGAPVMKEGKINVTANSNKEGQYFGETIIIKPTEAKTLKLTITAKVPIIVKVSSKDKVSINQRINAGTLFILPVPSLDTIKATVIANVTAGSSVEVSYNYFISDTSKVNVTGKQPKVCFEQLLTMANTDFANLYNGNIVGRIPDIEFANGLFAGKRAVCENGYIQQYTGMSLPEKDADKDVSEWNKTIKNWLKDYSVTDIKKLNKEQLIAKSNYLYDEATEYTKKNSQGATLFVVSVFKKKSSEGFYTGVLIAAK